MHITIFLASPSDKDHAQPAIDLLKEFGVDPEIVMYSAHKVPEKVIEKVTALNAAKEPTVIITFVGMSNGLSGVVAGSSVHPVIACPVFKSYDEYNVNVHSTLQMPSDVPVLTVLHPKNAALAAVRILAENDAELQQKMAKRIQEVKSKY